MTFTWSYSKYDLWQTCPLRYKLTHIDKAKPFERSPALERGDEVHKEIAVYLKSVEGGRMPDDVSMPFHRQLINEIRQFPGRIIEQKWAYDAHWRPTGYFADNAWLRNILDVGLPYEDGTFETIDWKTGKRYESNDEQMECFAVTVMGRFREAQAREVTTRLVYLDAGSEEIATFRYTDFEKLAAKWAANAAKVQNDRAFLPKPNAKCNWCPFSRSKGGPCRYG